MIEYSKNKLQLGINSILILSIAILLFFSSCDRFKEVRYDLAYRLAKENGTAESNKAIRELENKIRRVENQVEITVKAVRDKGTYWRLLGLKYMDYNMWEKAVEAFDEAIKIQPDFAVLQYNRALCISQRALSALSIEERSTWMNQAETGHRRALELTPRYSPAMYALAVILHYEKKESSEASRLLNSLLQIEKTNIKARFLLIQTYVNTGLNNQALAVCDDIVRLANNEDDRNKAEVLARQIKEMS